MLLSPWPTYKKKAKKIKLYTYNNNIRVCLLIRCTFPKKNEPVKCQLAGRDKRGSPRETTRQRDVYAILNRLKSSPQHVTCQAAPCLQLLLLLLFDYFSPHFPFAIFHFQFSSFHVNETRFPNSASAVCYYSRAWSQLSKAPLDN